MIVTKIEKFDKSRAEIFIDGSSAFLLYLGEIRELKLREGEEIGQDAYQKILEEVLPKRAKLRGLALLTKKPYTRKQLLDKYTAGKYPESVINEAMEYLESFNYINDVTYATDYINTYKESRSALRIKNDLMKKGISKADIGRAFMEVEYSEDGGIDEVSQIKKLVIKRKFNAVAASYEETNKFAASLMRKGYSSDAIWTVLKKSYGEDY